MGSTGIFKCGDGVPATGVAALLRGGEAETTDPPKQSTSSETQTPTPIPTPGQPPETVAPIEIPVDFSELQAGNPDIYAWLSLPDAGIDYPVVQRFGDDSYYLRRDVDGKYAIGGSLFTEFRYNVTDFSDPVTVIYGHAMDNGTMFGQLQSWSQTADLGENAGFTIYQPGRRLTYRVFAAVPYDSSHVLYYHNFHEEQVYTEFFGDVFATRDLHAVLDPEGRPEYGDKVVILATCLRGNSSRRFLVMGVLTEDTTALS